MKYLLSVLITLLCITNANADFTQCKDDFYQGKPPAVTNPKLEQNTYQICYNGFAVLYSGITKTPLYSAELLTYEKVEQGKAFERANQFHADKAITAQYSASLNDYRNSGYDKGHLTPFADLGSKESQYDSFTLTNIAPQAPKNNEQAWRLLENTVRNSVTASDSAYVVTGIIYSSTSIKKVGSVFIPDYFYKVVFYPSSSKEIYYLIQNNDTAKVQQVSKIYLQNLSNINFFQQ